VGSWNCLIKACCYRGAFHRALKILNETMPQKGIEPDSYSYNTILAGLARVGDVPSLKELLVSMTNKRVPIDKYTVQAISDGLLNVGDISGASTIVQDIFNQHDTLPPYTTHLKIIEFALSNGLIFEAKRHVYFIQQLWKWKPSPLHDNKFCEIMNATQQNPKLSKVALQKLFRYFGEELRDEDFF
jgi:pentatricopeptide repeat protein